MRDKLSKLEHEVKIIEDAQLITRVSMVPVLVKDLLGVLHSIIQRVEELEKNGQVNR